MIPPSAAVILACVTAAGAPPPDATDRLRLVPGLVITNPVYGGVSSTGQPIGDYDFTATIVDVTRAADPADRIRHPGGITIAYAFTAPARSRGTRVITASDWKVGRRLSMFWPDGGSGPKWMFTSLVVSDATYADLKRGKRAEFFVDGPVPTARLEQDGAEAMTLLVNDERVTVRTLRAKADKGYTFWILDSAEMPLVLKVEGPFKSVVTGLIYPKAKDDVVAALEQRHEVVTHAILFDFDADTIKPESRPVLDAVAAYLRAHPTLTMSVEGHTDGLGEASYNLELSRRRAASVKRYLAETQGIAAARIVTAGKGMTEPIADDATPQGRAQNRRVVLRTR